MLKRVPWQSLLLALLVVSVLPFARHSVVFGLEGYGLGTLRETRLFRAGAPFANLAIFGHMLAGAAITLLAPLQLSGTLRRRFPGWHRWAGRTLVLGALVAGVAGLVYILSRGTIGGGWMDAGFALYGLLLMGAALQSIRFARARDFQRHRAWALRLFVLAIGSWIYRVHYGLWYLATDGAGSAQDFSGPFDLIQNFAFYLPYLALVELWLRLRPRVAV
jgi:uncharacterized membrane protein YhaH (DUF805 family)